MKPHCPCCQPMSPTMSADFCAPANPTRKKKKKPNQATHPSHQALEASQQSPAEQDPLLKHSFFANENPLHLETIDLENPNDPLPNLQDNAPTDRSPLIENDDNIEKVDGWTWLTLPTELMKSGLDSYIFLLPTVANWTKDRRASLDVKIGVAVFSACIGLGTAYCHFVINYLNQSSRTDTQIKQTLSEQWRPWIIAGLVAALAFDALGHGFEGTALTNGDLSETALPFTEELMLNTGLLIASILISWADIRTCLASISRLFDIEFPQPTSFETKVSPTIALLGRYYCVFFANLYYYGGLIDRNTGWDKTQTPLGISKNSLYAATGFVAFLAAATAYCQYLLNIASLNLQQATASPSAPAKLHLLQRAALLANWIVGSGELAASIDFVFNENITNLMVNMSNEKIPRPVCSMIVSGLGLTAGAITYYPSQRTFTRTMLKANAVEALKKATPLPTPPSV